MENFTPPVEELYTSEQLAAPGEQLAFLDAAEIDELRAAQHERVERAGAAALADIDADQVFEHGTDAVKAGRLEEMLVVNDDIEEIVKQNLGERTDENSEIFDRSVALFNKVSINNMSDAEWTGSYTDTNGDRLPAGRVQASEAKAVLESFAQQTDLGLEAHFNDRFSLVESDLTDARSALTSFLANKRRWKNIDSNEDYQELKTNLATQLARAESLIRQRADLTGRNENVDELIRFGITEDGLVEGAGYENELSTILSNAKAEASPEKDGIRGKIKSGLGKAAVFMSNHRKKTWVAQAAVVGGVTAATGGLGLGLVAGGAAMARKMGSFQAVTATRRFVAEQLSTTEELHGALDALDRTGETADSVASVSDAFDRLINVEVKERRKNVIGSVSSLAVGVVIGGTGNALINNWDSIDVVAAHPFTDRHIGIDFNTDATVADSIPNMLDVDELAADASTEIAEGASEVISAPVTEISPAAEIIQAEIDQSLLEATEATAAMALEIENAPAFNYEVAPGEGVTHVIEAMAKEMGVAEQLTPQDYYDIYQATESDWANLDGMYNDFDEIRIATAGEMTVPGGEFSFKIEGLLNEKADLAPEGSTMEALDSAGIETEAPEVTETPSSPEVGDDIAFETEVAAREFLDSPYGSSQFNLAIGEEIRSIEGVSEDFTYSSEAASFVEQNIPAERIAAIKESYAAYAFDNGLSREQMFSAELPISIRIMLENILRAEMEAALPA